MSLPSYHVFNPRVSASPHPSLLSSIAWVFNFFPVCRLISGSFCTFWLSTEKPTPVPHMSKYKISAKSFIFAGAVNEQLYPHTFVLRAASPALHISRMEG